ncbi:MAG: Slp family lipoprotein [Granulosicoccaceae bacterium]
MINFIKKHARLALYYSVLVASLVSCATNPVFDVDSIDVLNQNPHSIVAATNEECGDVPSGKVIWGGVIVSAHNLSDRTQLEILSYPLSNYQRPLTDEKPTGRFLIQSAGYLELASYQQGRLITVLGSVQDVTQGTVGDSDYQYPTITSNELHLWLTDKPAKTGVVFGIGISLGG